jgi:hypothetical protein
VCTAHLPTSPDFGHVLYHITACLYCSSYELHLTLVVFYIIYRLRTSSGRVLYCITSCNMWFFFNFIIFIIPCFLTFHVNDMGSHRVHTFTVPKVRSALAWWWLFHSWNMWPYVIDIISYLTLIYCCVLDSDILIYIFVLRLTVVEVTVLKYVIIIV